MPDFNGVKERGGAEIVDIRLARADKDATEITQGATAATRAFGPFFEGTYELVHEQVGYWITPPELASDWDFSVMEKLFVLKNGDASRVTPAVVRHVYKQLQNGMMQ